MSSRRARRITQSAADGSDQRAATPGSHACADARTPSRNQASTTCTVVRRHQRVVRGAPLGHPAPGGERVQVADDPRPRSHGEAGRLDPDVRTPRRGRLRGTRRDSRPPRRRAPPTAPDASSDGQRRSDLCSSHARILVRRRQQRLGAADAADAARPASRPPQVRRQWSAHASSNEAMVDTLVAAAVAAATVATGSSRRRSASGCRWPAAPGPHRLGSARWYSPRSPSSNAFCASANFALSLVEQSGDLLLRRLVRRLRRPDRLRLPHHLAAGARRAPGHPPQPSPSALATASSNDVPMPTWSADSPSAPPTDTSTNCRIGYDPVPPL